MGVKSKYVALMLACVTCLTGCGGSSSYSDSVSVAEVSYDSDYVSGAGIYNGFDSYSLKSADSGASAGYVEEAEYAYEDEASGDYDVVVPEEAEEQKMNLEMLIYSGNVSISTKQFSDDLTKLKSMLDEYDCFYEDESKWTEYSYDDRNLYRYSATVRVKSSEYSDLLDGLNEVGTVTNLSSSCQNVSAEYSDTIVAIDIYEAERDRYVNLLSTITDDQYAIEVQRELTDIELKLAQYRARKQNIETDVSYSYVYINLVEVRDYEKQTEYNDGFFTRLWNTIVNTYYDFTAFVEGFLFAVIHATPYVLFWAILYIILKKLGLLNWISNTGVYKSLKVRWEEKREDRRARKNRKHEQNNFWQDVNNSPYRYNGNPVNVTPVAVHNDNGKEDSVVSDDDKETPVVNDQENPL